jgi:hypothetical protein
MDADWIYWLESGILRRKRKDDTSGIESLHLGSVLGRAVDGGTEPTERSAVATAIAIDGSWLYATFSASVDPDLPCTPNRSLCRIARWPSTIGGAREVVLEGGFPTGPRAEDVAHSFRVLAGEVVFSADRTYSCKGDSCADTLRPLGMTSPSQVAGDADNLYWCTAPQLRSEDRVAIQRVARLR